MADQNVLLNTITNSHNFNFTNIVLPSQPAASVKTPLCTNIYVKMSSMYLPLAPKGLTISCTNEIVQSTFSDGVLILRYINKMGTNGGGRVVDGVPLRRLQAILVPG